MPAGVVGHCGLRSPTVMLGYWNDSREHLPQPVPSGYYLTGDLMYRDDDGYYYHMDRAVDSVDLGDGTGPLHRACPRSGSCAPARTSATARWSRSATARRVVTDVLLLLAADADPDVDRIGGRVTRGARPATWPRRSGR